MALPLLLAFLAPSCAKVAEPQDLSDSNLLLITIDTLRSDRLGAYGDRHAATPTIDDLASRGVRFANCYSPVPLTLPSHSALFTGRYPFSLPVRNNGSYFLEEDELTLAERLQSRGLATAAFVSTYILGSKFGLSQGFDHYDDGLGDQDLIRSLTSEIPADRVYERFSEWLIGTRPKRFFAWVHFYDPHLPYSPPDPFRGRFAQDPYRGEIAFVDAQIARILADVEAYSGLEKTLVVVTSDHGEAFGEHGEVGHGIFAYDESLRVPLILHAPGRLPEGRIVEERVRLIDLLPTLIELYGLGPVPDLPARSLLPLLHGEQQGDAREVYFESVLGLEDYNWAPITGLISGSHKLISLPQPELYDLRRDPAERENLHDSHPDLAEELEARLRAILLEDDSAEREARRDLTPEDVAHLRALGYLGSSEQRTSRRIDPKRGIRIDQQIKEIRSLLDAGDADAAETSVGALLRRFPDLEMAALYALRHEIAIRQGNESAASGVLREGVERFPQSERLALLLAHYLVKSGRFEDGERVSRDLLARNPRVSQAMILLGQASEAQGDFAVAAEQYERALTLEPKSQPLRRRLAEALIAAGELTRSAAVFNELAAEGVFENDGEQLFRVAMLNARVGDPERAELLFRRGLDLTPAGIHHVTFAVILIRNGKGTEARQHLEIALSEYGDELTPEQTELARSTLRQLRADGSDGR
jgi:arylsulfatase A-like enzyme/Tfp pilus assembly protein PilF